MLKTGSLKRSIETNKIQKDKVMAKVGEKGQNDIRNKKNGAYRDQTIEHSENFMAINFKTYIK